MSREEAIKIEAHRCEWFAELAEIYGLLEGDEKARRMGEQCARRSHYAYLAMIRLEGKS